MKMRFAVLSLVALLCFVAPVMAGPIQMGTPWDAGSTTGSDLGLLGQNVLSSLHSAPLGNSSLSGSFGDPLITTGGGSDHIVYQGGPPIPAPVPEPSGVMVMLGSGLFGVAALVRRKLRA